MLDCNIPKFRMKHQQFKNGKIKLASELVFLAIFEQTYSFWNTRYNFHIFPTLPQIFHLSPPKFWENPKFNHTSLCILLKLDCAKFGVSNLCFQKLLKKNLCGVGSTNPPPPPLPNIGKGKVRLHKYWYFGTHASTNELTTNDIVNLLNDSTKIKVPRSLNNSL